MRTKIFQSRHAGESIGGRTLLRIRGVDLKVHVSLLILLVYVVLVAGVQFPSVVSQSGVDPDRIIGGAFVWSVLFALLLFVSVAVHEFGHVIAAQMMGVRVKGVTLMMLGGVSEMERIPEKPYAEFKLSIVGPLVSFALAGILLWISASADQSPNLALLTYWVGRVNLALGIFNVLPIFPLDGGRAFRSLLAVRYGMARATLTAVRMAKVLAWGLGILAFLSFNFLLLLIAFFIYTAATSELAISVSRGVLRGVLAGRVGTRTVVVPGRANLTDVAEIMLQNRARVLPVEGQDGDSGVITSEILRRIPRRIWSEVSADEAMVPAAHVVDAEAPLEEVVPEIAAARVLPLGEQGKVVGLIRYTDLTDLVEVQGLAQTEVPKAAA